MIPLEGSDGSEQVMPMHANPLAAAGEPGRRRPRVLLADDHAILADMLRNLLQPEFEVVATVSDGIHLVEAVERTQPDIVIADIAMPGCSGIEAARQIHARTPTTRLVFLTMQDDAVSAAEAFAIGAAAYILKSAPATEFLEALRRVAEGGQYLAPEILRGNIRALAGLWHSDTMAQISAREREVLGLLVAGLPMKAVARRLGITARTVAFHKYKAMETLGLKDNAELIEFALRHHLLGKGHTNINC